MTSVKMQHKLGRLYLLFCILLASCGDEDKVERKEVHDGNIVYICTGRYSKKYHSTDKCPGLSKCKASIIETPIEEARTNYKPCRYCIIQ